MIIHLRDRIHFSVVPLNVGDVITVKLPDSGSAYRQLFYYTDTHVSNETRVWEITFSPDFHVVYIVCLLWDTILFYGFIPMCFSFIWSLWCYSKKKKWSRDKHLLSTWSAPDQVSMKSASLLSIQTHQIQQPAAARFMHWEQWLMFVSMAPSTEKECRGTVFINASDNVYYYGVFISYVFKNTWPHRIGYVLTNTLEYGLLACLQIKCFWQAKLCKHLFCTQWGQLPLSRGIIAVLQALEILTMSTMCGNTMGLASNL